ncbi:hypothetical protein ES708_32231 [subsurface metagenome]
MDRNDFFRKFGSVNTGGSYVQLNDILLQFEFPRPSVELDYQGSFSFNTSDDDIFTISVSGRSGTFRFSVYYDNNYYSISRYFLIATRLWYSIYTICLQL